MKTLIIPFYLLLIFSEALLPPKFQWKYIDFAWKSNRDREVAIDRGAFIPGNNMPTGIARWKNKLFITVPRWKKGVPSSLNYIYLNGVQTQALNPYPDWEAAILDPDSCPASNTTVVSTFRIHIDKCKRLWVVDNGVTDIMDDVQQLSEPAIMVFDLNSDALLHKYYFCDDVLRDCSVVTSVVVDTSKGCRNAYAYITDMGANALIVYSLKDNRAWRVEQPRFDFDPTAGVYRVGGVDFFWGDGVSTCALGTNKDLYFSPTSSTKLFKISTKLLKNDTVTADDIAQGVTIVGDRGPNSQVTASDFDRKRNILFFTLLSKNGVGCWNVDKVLNKYNAPVIISDCNLLEFPNDVKVDKEDNLWILSNRQSRFIYEVLNPNTYNYRVLMAPVRKVIEGSACVGSSGNILPQRRSSTSNSSRNSKSSIGSRSSKGSKSSKHKKASCCDSKHCEN